VLFQTFTWSYKAGGYIVTFLDQVDPNINIEIGNIEGAAVDWTIDLIESSPTGTGYIDLPVDADGNFIFPDAPVIGTFDDGDWWDCSFIGC